MTEAQIQKAPLADRILGKITSRKAIGMGNRHSPSISRICDL